ncbi:MAG TPA: hypothetical protein VN924_12925 [Bryobacteraceae bacterium]|nr:hypothetical protein [Bryobacteraceae bacterium]
MLLAEIAKHHEAVEDALPVGDYAGVMSRGARRWHTCGHTRQKEDLDNARFLTPII